MPDSTAYNPAVELDRAAAGASADVPNAISANAPKGEMQSHGDAIELTTRTLRPTIPEIKTYEG